MAQDTAPTRDVSSRKRDQVRRAQRTMFFWVAGMSAVVGFALVLAWFMWQQSAFRTAVVNKKSDTVSTLVQNNEAVPELKKNLRLLEVNQALQSAKVSDDERSLQVILDALPSTSNSLALGASVQQRLAADIPNLAVESLTTGSQDQAATNTAQANTLPFRMVVSSTDANALKELLRRFELSIRVIDIDSLTLDRSADRYTMTLDAHAYYEPAKTIELQKTTIKPQSRTGAKR